MARSDPLVHWKCDGCGEILQEPVNRPPVGWRTLEVSKPPVQDAMPNPMLNLANALVKAEAKIDLCGPCLGKVNTFIHEELGK